MEKTVRLNEEFYSFTQASKSSEAYYLKLGEKVRYLTQKLEKKNAQLNDTVSNLSESKDFLQAVLQSIGEAMIVLYQDEKITMMNRAAEKLFSIASYKTCGVRFHEIERTFEEGAAGTTLCLKRIRIHNPVKGSLREMDLVFSTLEETSGNKTRTAKILGVSVRTIRNKLQEYGKNFPTA